jgi:hypothetical protein
METRYTNIALKILLYHIYIYIYIYIHIYKLVCIYTDVSTSYVLFTPSSFTFCLPYDYFSLLQLCIYIPFYF